LGSDLFCFGSSPSPWPHQLETSACTPSRHCPTSTGVRKREQARVRGKRDARSRLPLLHPIPSRGRLPGHGIHCHIFSRGARRDDRHHRITRLVLLASSRASRTHPTCSLPPNSQSLALALPSAYAARRLAPLRDAGRHPPPPPVGQGVVSPSFSPPPRPRR
jgi:hypothetical protein